MATPVACVAVSDAGPPSQAALSNLPGLQLLLRILPFRSSGNHNRQQLQQQVAKLSHRASALEELHRHPLWRYGSTAAQWPGPKHTSNKLLPPAEAESALLAYVRLAADAEQQQGLRRQSRRQLSTADIAAELHALYTLAAIHVAHQQDPLQHGADSSAHHRDKQALPDGDVMQLLKAYASLEDRGQQGSSAAHAGTTWDSKTQAAAAAMEALWAFARLADTAQQEVQQQGEGQSGEGQQAQQQQQQQQSSHAPGQLQASNPSSFTTQHSHKQGSRGSSSDGNGSSTRSSVGNSSGDLQVLLKLAQLGLQAAS